MLEAEIVKLREAVEALTAALEKNPIVAASAPTVKEVPKNQDEPPKNQDGVTIETIKDAALKAARAGHKDAIRKKLAEMNAPKLQDLSPEQTIEFHRWVNTLEAK
jgi:hypothetical protein